MTRICTCPGSLASSLESSIKRNQLAGASCKSCGGRFLVDGIGPLSRSMLGTVGLEVTNSINCELSWTTVKGKRSRKSVARNNGRVALGNKSPKRVGDFSGSDSDKFGEPGTGQCFPDKAEYVPIKKRRHYLRSPSPSLRTSLYSGQSVSPQLRTPSSHSDDLEHLSDHNGSSGSYTNRRGFVAARVGNGVNEGVVSDKVSEETSGELYNSDNFSGIALLAAAACINNIDDDPYEGKGDALEISSLPQRSDASTSSLPVRECIPCSESGKQMDKDASLLDNKEGCSLVVESSHGAPSSSEENEEGKSASSKIDRRHWDLNTLMDAWEQPNEDTSAQYKCDDTCIDGMPMEKLDKEGSVIQRDCISNGSGSESCLPLDHIESATQSSTAKMKENGSEEFCQTSHSSLSGHSMEPVKYSLADEKVSSHVLGSHGSFTNCPLSESCHSSEGSGGNLDIKSRPVSTMIPGADSCRDASSLVTTSEQNVVLPDASESEKFGGENDGQLRDPEDSEKKTELPDNRIALGLEKCIGTCKTLDAENLQSISGENTHPSSKCEGLSISDISVGGHSTVISDAKGQDGKILADNELGTDAARCLGFKQLPSKGDDPHVRDEEGEGRSILQDSGKGFVLDDCHNSDVSQDDPGCINGRDKIDELQVGYDSPYEDGELRGSVLYSWEENELEDGENECLDYESDGRVGEGSDSGDSPSSKVVEAGSEGSQGKEKKGLLGVQSQETDSRRSTSVKSSSGGESKEIREKIETAGKKVSNQGSGTTEELSTDVIVERNYGSRRGRTSDHMDGLDVKGSYAGVGSKATRGKLQSRIEGPSTLDAMERDNVYTLQGRSRNSGSSYSRENRDGCPDRYVTRYRPAVQERERNGGNNQLVYWDSRSRYPSSYRGPEGQVPNRQRSSINDPADKFGGVNSHDHKQSMNYSSRTERDSSPDRFATRYRSAVHERERIGGDGHLFYWESRNRYPSSYRGPEGQGQPRPRSVIADSVDKFGGLDPHDHKQSVNYSSKSMQRPLGWRRSPVDRDEYHGSQRRIAAFSSNRNRGGSRNFTEGVGRGPRGEYHQPMDDDAASSVRMPHYLSWKERGFFAPSTKGAHASVPRRDSRSRSRTRSPRAWHPQRERNLGARRHSRSPDFRSEARMNRMRAPFQKPNFAADYGEGFMSPPRGRFSPQRNFRGLDDRNFLDSHLRHRRSPLNVFRQSQRLESIGLSGRLKSDDSFRPMMRPGRFPHTAGLGRGCKLEENDDDKRHDDRSGMMH